MSADTKIEYSDSSVNPVSGCEGCELWNPKVSTCYAGNMTNEWAGAKGWPKNFNVPEMFEGRMKQATGYGDLTGKDRQHKPWLNGRPRHIFIADMGDLFSSTIPFQWIADEVINNIGSVKGARHFWFIFTKRASRQAEFIKWYGETQGIMPRNIIWMVSVTSPLTLKRLELLLEVPNIIRGVSIEPLLAATNIAPTLTKASHDLNWIVAGAESGEHHRVCNEDWLREIRDTAAEWELPYFLKQTVSADGHKIQVPRLDGKQHVEMFECKGDLLI